MKYLNQRQNNKEQLFHKTLKEKVRRPKVKWFEESASLSKRCLLNRVSINQKCDGASKLKLL